MRVKEKIYSILMAGVLLLSPLTTAVQAAPVNSNVDLYKLEYKDTVTEQTNTGLEMDIKQFGDVALWNSAKHGKVGFTMYKLDDAQLPSVTANNAQAVADEVEKAVLDNTTLPYGATKVGEELIVDNATSKVSFTGTAEGLYVLVETTKPATVTQHAKPMFVSLPITNTEGTGYLDTVSLYPKNKVQAPVQDLIKYVQRNADEAPSLFEGATFELYSGNPGAGVLVEGSEQNTTAEGKISVTDLVVGDYYFVEKATNAEGIMLKPEFVNADTNKLTFTYTDAGTIVFPEGSLLAEGQKVINYEEPSITNTVVDERPIKSYNIGDTINFNIALPLPHDIGTYEEYFVTDDAFQGLTIDANSIAIEGLVKDTDYTVEETGTGFIVRFVPANLPNGTTINMTYTGIINDNAKAGEEQVNKATLDFNNGVETGKKESEDKVITYEHKLHKLGKGIFDTALGRVDLEGAEFIISKSVGGVDNYLVKATDSITWSTDKAQATVFTTGADGYVTISGLVEGTYKATEIKAPADYKLPTNPDTTFEIKAHAVDAAETTEIINVAKPDMPMTGTEKTVIALAGLTALVIAGVVLSKNKKKETVR